MGLRNPVQQIFVRNDGPYVENDPFVFVVRGGENAEDALSLWVMSCKRAIINVSLAKRPAT